MSGKKIGKTDFAALLARDVPNSDTAARREQIEYIDIDRIDDDPKNFYELSGLEELAANIELCGLQQPIRVRPDPGDDDHVIIVSGHRRRAAMRMLVEDGKEAFRSVPCIRESGEVSEEMRELRLIFANSATREMTSAEKAKQAERVKELLYKLKAQGVEFPGRMRDHVAEACNISKSKLARLEVIQKQLEGDLAQWFERGTLSEQAAYALARLPMEVQWTVAEVAKEQTVNGSSAEKLVEYWPKISQERTCSYGFPGDPCDNLRGRIKGTVCQKYGYNYCDGRCCMNCYHADSCPGKCKHRRAQDKSDAAARKAAREEENAREATRKAGYKTTSTANALRLLRAAEVSGLPDDVKISWSKRPYDPSVSIELLRKRAAGDWGDANFYGPAYSPNDMDLVKVAGQLGCTADYLLGLTEEPKPKAPVAMPEGWVPLKFVDGREKPPRTGLYYCKFDCGGAILHDVVRWDDFGRWVFDSTGVEIDAECLAWFPLPKEDDDDDEADH